MASSRPIGPFIQPPIFPAARCRRPCAFHAVQISRNPIACNWVDNGHSLHLIGCVVRVFNRYIAVRRSGGRNAGYIVRDGFYCF